MTRPTMPCPLCGAPEKKAGCPNGCQPTGLDYLNAAIAVAKRVMAEA